MSHSSLLKAIVTAGAAVIIISGNTATPAQAATVQPAGFGEHCYVLKTVWEFTGSMTGWCDGTGPDTYSTYVQCSDLWANYNSPPAWFGDTRGTTATCPTGHAMVAYGFNTPGW